VESAMQVDPTKGFLSIIICSASLNNYLLVNCTTSARDRSGGLDLIWNNNVKIDIQNFIDCYVFVSECNENWRATCLYGFLTKELKAKTCDLINDFTTTNSHDKWLLFNDFNIIKDNSEKQGKKRLMAML
jgi:hypothetical protein